MKRLLVFSVALGLGAATVIGQGDEGENELNAQVARLTRLLKQYNARRKPPAAATLELRSYDVSDLCSPILDAELVPFDLYESGVATREPEEMEPTQPYSADMIIELLRQTVAPASWDTLEGADVQPRDGLIYVSTLPAVHALIPPMLKRLRALVETQVVVEVVAVRVAPEAAARIADRPRELTAEEAKGLRAQAPLGRARLVCFDGQQVVQANGTRRAYVADYDVRVAEQAAVGEPRRAKLFDGCAVQVRACLDRGGGGVVLHCRLERTATGEVRRRETAHGAIDLPEVDLTRVETSFWAPLDRTVVAGGSAGGDGESCIFLVTARRVGSG